MIENIRTHDLLRINLAGVSALADVAEFPSVCLKNFPFVVVRRTRSRDGLIPVGIRGKERHERCAAWINPHHIVATVTPESIESCAALPRLPAFESLFELRRRWPQTRLKWGPTGSVAFELVSGCNVVHEKSDLDIAVRAPTPLSAICLRMLAEAAKDLPCALDIQIETPHGGFSLQEFVSAATRCLLRTIHGPRLVDNPWLPSSNSESD